MEINSAPEIFGSETACSMGTWCLIAVCLLLCKVKRRGELLLDSEPGGIGAEVDCATGDVGEKPLVRRYIEANVCDFCVSFSV